MKSQETAFLFVGYDLDKERGEVDFHYGIRFSDQTEYFSEKLLFPIKGINFSRIPREILQSILNNLLLMLGVSYWKLYCPKKIEITNNWLTKEQAEFWNKVYTKGLGEFFYKNQIDFRGLVQFPYHSNDTYHYSANAFPRKDKSLLMLGGGKDSIVTAELLKKHGEMFTTFVVNDYPIQREIVRLLGVESIIVKREIDQKLLELNKRKEVYNGHVPISAIYAFIGIFAAALYNYRYIISSNEASANYGNLKYLGETINHQWSKSLEFEVSLQAYVKKYLTPNIYYFSLTRPFHEIKIAQLFSKYPKYFSAFSSCNRNFTINKHLGGVVKRHPRGGRMDSSGVLSKRWCGECAKCAFIFVTLAAFLPKEQIVKIFGKNLFADASLIDTYKELLGIKGVKPFECVGTPDEVKIAFYLTHKKGEFDSDIVMGMFINDVLPKLSNAEQLKMSLLSTSNNHSIPKEFLPIV